jgi:hypothetical protein
MKAYAEDRGVSFNQLVNEIFENHIPEKYIPRTVNSRRGRNTRGRSLSREEQKPKPVPAIPKMLKSRISPEEQKPKPVPAIESSIYIDPTVTGPYW